MSLVGNLEDLGLGDILQIVSLSRKSGVLNLGSRGREGKVVFYNGQVIRATSSTHKDNLGHILLRKKLVDVETLKQALILQARSPGRERIGTILSEHFGISRDEIEAVVKEHVEKVVYSFFTWSEGAFSFDLGAQEDPAATQFSPLQFMLDQGLNPQWLAMEGSRILDEKRHHGEDADDVVAEPVTDLDDLLGELVAAPVERRPVTAEVETETLLDEADLLASSVAGSGPLVMLVDDDSLTRQALDAIFVDRGCDVRAFAEGRSFLAALEKVVADGGLPILVIDLIMPRMDGSGILGGLELIDRLAERHAGLPTFVLTDHPNQDAEVKLREKGFSETLAKPKKDVLRHGEGQGDLKQLVDRVLDSGAAESGPLAPAENYHHLGLELIAELGDDSGLSSSKGPESPGLHLLKGMLQELNNPSLGGGIILLVLRFASEMMNRAVIFLVKDDEIVGLGQFGIELAGESADLRIRRMSIPRREPSVLGSALKMMTPVRAEPGETKWDLYLQEQLGGERPTEIFLGPILSEGKVVALLYGDNLPEQQPVGETESLEIFLSQAGQAMEKTLLERRLKSRDAC